MNRQQRKHLVKELVTSRDLPRLTELAKTDKRVVGVLCALLFEQDERFRWRAIEALGLVSAVVADTDLQSVRELLRRLEWLMNDESGGAGWHDPEAMAAIGVSVPQLLDVFGVLLGSYLNNEALSRGAHWAVTAVAKVRPDLLTDKTEELIASLGSADPYIRGYAVIALAAIEGESVMEKLESLRDDSGTLDLYGRSTGELRTTTVGALARLLTSAGEEQRNSVDVW
jgi:HEAT repeat protein